jgi:hypothetical protein
VVHLARLLQLTQFLQLQAVAELVTQLVKPPSLVALAVAVAAKKMLRELHLHQVKVTQVEQDKVLTTTQVAVAVARVELAAMELTAGMKDHHMA